MTKVNMNQEQFKLGEADPQLPREAQEAGKNHMGMTVPADFFQQFERKMNAVIDAEVNVERTHTINTQSSQKSVPQIGRRWISIAAGVVVLAVIGMALQFNWFGTQIIEQQNLLVEASSSAEEELNPAEDIYYTSLSDYEVYDLICGL